MIGMQSYKSFILYLAELLLLKAIDFLGSVIVYWGSYHKPVCSFFPNPFQNCKHSFLAGYFANIPESPTTANRNFIAVYCFRSDFLFFSPSLHLGHLTSHLTIWNTDSRPLINEYETTKYSGKVEAGNGKLNDLQWTPVISSGRIFNYQSKFTTQFS